MDDYGIGACALAGLQVYSDLARQSGRDHRMIRDLPEGVTVVCYDHSESRFISRMIAEIRPDLTNVRCVEGGSPEAWMGAGRVVFSHRVVEMTYQRAINEVLREFERHGGRDAWPQLPDHIPRPLTTREQMGDWERQRYEGRQRRSAEGQG